MLFGCYQGGDAINIDGLMNNDVQPYIKSNNLPVYLSEKQTQFVVVFLNMFSNSALKAGGYDNREFLNRFHSVRLIDEGEFDWNI